jgi:hypothetical protein
MSATGQLAPIIGDWLGVKALRGRDKPAPFDFSQNMWHNCRQSIALTERNFEMFELKDERHHKNAVLASIIASVVAGVIGIGSALYSYHVSMSIQDQARLEQIGKFDQSTEQISDAAQSFIAAINDNNKGLDPARTKLRIVLASEIIATQNISQFFDKNAKDNTEKYQNTLEEFNDISYAKVHHKIHD